MSLIESGNDGEKSGKKGVYPQIAAVVVEVTTEESGGLEQGNLVNSV